MGNIEGLFPKCQRCGATMHAVWFVEEETKIENGVLIRTGRVRDNISHFEHECGTVQAVDDTFARPWRNK